MVTDFIGRALYIIDEIVEIETIVNEGIILMGCTSHLLEIIKLGCDPH